MNLRITILTLILFSSLSVRSEAPILSSKATVSLLTCSPGEELYSLFGHSALRIADPEKQIDVVFNYGTFNFDENFYYNFSMGRLNYRLSVSSMENFMAEYEYYERGVIQQTLDIDSAEVQKIFEFLDWNLLPENRFYLYDFFYNNCSSVLRDVIETQLDKSLEFRDLQEPLQPTFRDLIDVNLVYHPWGDFGIDLGLGLPCEAIPTSREYMFLPDKLMQAFDKARYQNKPLVRETSELLPAKGLEYSWSIFDPIPLFWVLFGLIAIISGFGLRNKSLSTWVDALLLLVIGSVGALVFFLWFITDHTATANNFNMLWAWPTHIFAIPLLFFSRLRKIYFTAYGIVLLITLLAFPILPQSLHLATVPLILALLLRSFVNFKLVA